MSTRYISTRGQTAPMGFAEAVMTGLARDGGLLLPETIPDARPRLDSWKRLPYRDLAFEVMSLFSDLPPAALRDLIGTSYARFAHPEITPLVQAGGLHVLELFHGPTLAFKDVALQFLGALFEHILRERGGELNIVAATSGDTGSAAIDGVRGRDRIRIFVLFPHGRVSPIQERQMTTIPDANVFALSVRGTFDDCQAIVKTLFSDLPFRDAYGLGAVNSINWARVLAQIVYYFYGAFRLMERTGARAVRAAVPTGNFGDIFAGYVACRMGLPISKLILATNENDILARFFASGTYAAGRVHASVSPSMDIQVASNFERYLYYLAEENGAVVREWMRTFREKGALTVDGFGARPDPLFEAGSAGTAETLATIRRVYESSGYLLDPHTAVGVAVAGRFADEREPTLHLATAHPAKFGDAIRAATGRDLAHHPALDRLLALPARSTELAADDAAVRTFIEDRVPGKGATHGA